MSVLSSIRDLRDSYNGYLDFMIKFIWHLYNSSQITISPCHLLLTSHSTGTILTSNWTLNQKSKLCCNRRLVGILVSSTRLGLMTSFLLLSDSCKFVDLELSLCRLEVLLVLASAVILGSESRGASVSDLRFLQPGGLGPLIYIPQEQCGPFKPPDTWFRFRRLLRLAGLW
jgi:hypothetical protein